eukprot:9168125-Pyramimonas_sp.AAC.1
MFGHHVGNLFFSTRILKLDMFILACFAYPIQVDTVCAMKMAKCWTIRCTLGELLVGAGSGSTCSRVPSWEIVRLLGVASVSDCSGSCVRLGEDPLVGDALRGGVLRRRFLAARVEHIVVPTRPNQPRQLVFSLQ